MDTHAFTPSRQDGIVCVARRRGPSGLGDVEACGYPPGHPIHKTLLRKSLTEKYGPGEPGTPAEAPDPINVLRDIVAAYVPEDVHSDAAHAFVQLHAERAPRANAPAEARVGISDREAAALTAVAELGRTLHATGVDPAWFESRLRLIEQALLRGER